MKEEQKKSMKVQANGPRRLCFGLCEVSLPARELYRRGVRIRLQDKPFRILLMLLQRPGEVVTREELQKCLWTGDTFIEFDEGLNTAIRKLRYALGDSSENPTYIETVPRSGYRFIAPVKALQDTWESGIPHNETSSAPSRVPGSSSGDQLQADTQSQTEGVEQSSASLPETQSRAAQKSFWQRMKHASLISAVTVVVLFALSSAYFYFRTTPAASKPMHFLLLLPANTRDLSISHSGQILAFVAPLPRQGGTALWVREIGASESHLIENTEGASYPFWSPDDRFIGFFADGKLKKAPVTGEALQVICDAPIGRGGTWNRDDVIVFAGDSGVGMRRVSGAGGQAAMLPGFEQKVATTTSNRWPFFLPDGEHFLYTSIDFSSDLRSDSNAIYVASLHSPQHRRLVTSNANAAYIAPYLVFSQDGTLIAQPFDADRLRVTGQGFAIANEIEYLSSIARSLYSVSENGTLVYESGPGATFSQLAWFDRQGKRVGAIGSSARYANPRLSPDGKRVAVDIDDPESSNTDIWLIGAKDQAPLRLTFNPSQDESPLWSHDGKRVLWLSDRGGKNGFYVKDSDGSTIQESPTMPLGVGLSFASAPSDWSPDGSFLLYTDLQEGDALHLWTSAMNQSISPHRLLTGVSADIEGQFSPDGHWVAYSSNESGRWEVYVASFPDTTAKYQVSTDGGQQPRWRRDGRELFFLSRDRKLMAASVKTGPRVEFKRPVALFQTSAHEPITAEEFFTYDVTADGHRFLINSNTEQGRSRPVEIVLNWASIH